MNGSQESFAWPPVLWSPPLFVVAGRASHVPMGAGYAVLLLCHVAAAVVGFGALVVTGIQASRARRGPEGASSEAVRRYFRPGVNWAGRVLYLVPVFGFALVGSSHGDFGPADGFVVSGLVLWAAAAIAAEAVVWPAERRIQHAVTSGWEPKTTLEADCTRVVVASSLLAVLFVAAVVVMVAQP